jgi:hypothetical protein
MTTTRSVGQPHWPGIRLIESPCETPPDLLRLVWTSDSEWGRPLAARMETAPTSSPGGAWRMG